MHGGCRCDSPGAMPVMNPYALVVLALAAMSCRNAPPATTSADGDPAGAAAAPAAATTSRSAATGGEADVSGLVAETMNSGGYTYARLTAARQGHLDCRHRVLAEDRRSSDGRRGHAHGELPEPHAQSRLPADLLRA